MTSNNILLDINDLSVTFTTENGDVKAVKKVSLSINEGETIAIVGESGAGKSQLFHALLGLQANNALLTGSAKFCNKEILNQPASVMNAIRGTGICIIFQDPMTALNPYLTVGKQLAEVLQIHKRLSYREAKMESIKALSEVKIPQPEKRFKQYPHELSGGMRQRVMIAMSLLTHPKLIIADEPTTALDVTVQTEIISLLKKIHDQHGSSIVLITHDIPLVAGLCNRIAIMYAGQIVEIATIEGIHTQAKHPYSRALIEATPSSMDQEGKKQPLKPIAGQPPSSNDVIKGCAFAPRCQLADKRCRQENPELIKVSSTHSVACFYRDYES